MMKRGLLVLGLCLLSAPAWAACGVTNLQVKDNAAVTAAVPYGDDGSGASNCSPQVQIKQAGNVAAVTASGADGVSNTTSGLQIYGWGYLFNGTTWDRARGDTTNGAWVNIKSSVALTANQGTSPWVGNTSQLGGQSINLGAGATGTGTQRITQASDSPEIAALGVPGGAAASCTQGASSNTLQCLYQLHLDFTGSQPAGSNTIGNTVPAPTSSSSLALTKVTCGSAASSCVLKNAAGNLYGVYAECTSACWLMVFNATSLPANGATTAGTGSGNLVDCIDITANGSKSLTYPTFPVNLSAGITAAISSTACATLTASTVGFISGTVQ